MPIQDLSISERLSLLVHTPRWLEQFAFHCLKEISLENLLFWINVQIFAGITKPHKQLLFARYIYLVYVHPDTSPLEVNIPNDIRRDIGLFEEAVATNLYPTLFDTAAKHVLGILRTQSFLSWMKTQDYTDFVSSLTSSSSSSTSPSSTQDQLLDTKAFYTYFRPDFTVIEERVKFLTSFAPTSLNTEETAASASLRFTLREQILYHTLYHYFPSSRHRLLQESRFEKASTTALNFLSQSQKRLKIAKDRKLTKFFGERVDTLDIQRQFLSVSSGMDGSDDTDDDDDEEDHDSEALGANDLENASLEHLNLIAGTERDRIGDSAVSVEPFGVVNPALNIIQTQPTPPRQFDFATKKKKVEKLRGFFGEARLPDSMVRRQISLDVLNDTDLPSTSFSSLPNINIGMHDTRESESESESLGLNQRFSLSVLNVLRLPTSSPNDQQLTSIRAEPKTSKPELDPFIKSQAILQARKIRQVLGEVDAQTQYDAVVKPMTMTKSKSSANKTEGSSSSQNLSRMESRVLSLESELNRGSVDALGSVDGEIAEGDVENYDDEDDDDEDGSDENRLRREKLKRISKILGRKMTWNMLENLTNAQNISDAKLVSS